MVWIIRLVHKEVEDEDMGLTYDLNIGRRSGKFAKALNDLKMLKIQQ